MSSQTPTRHFTHIWREPWIYTHPKPPRPFRREMEDLLKYSTRMDALKQFLNEKNLRTLTRLKGHVISFGDHDMFGNLIADFECTAAELTKAIRSMLRVPRELTFVREDIYDSRAWCHLLLNDFVSFAGRIINPKRQRDYNGHRAPEFMPGLSFAIRNAVWDVNHSDFKVERRQKHYKQICVMYFHHAQLNSGFCETGDKECRRWVGEMEIPEGNKLKDIEPLLFAEVEKECARHYVRITPSWQARRLTGDPLTLGHDYNARIHVK